VKENYLAIALGKKDIGETDRLYTFYTREAGMMRVSAKGIRKPHARLASHVEDFVVTRITIAKNHGPGILSGAFSEHTFDTMRMQLDAVMVLMYVRDVFVRMISGMERDDVLFDLYVDFLHASDAVIANDRTRSIVFLAEAFFIKIFFALGYGFTLTHCMHCRSVIDAREHFFVVGRGVICAQCAQQEKNTIRLSVHTIVFLRLVKQHQLRDIAKVRITAEVERQVRLLSRQTVTWIMR